MADASSLPTPSRRYRRLTARAVLLGERIDTAGLERSDVISTDAARLQGRDAGYVVLFRYGVVVLVGLSPLEEDEVIRGLGPRVIGAVRRAGGRSRGDRDRPRRDEQIAPGGPIIVRDLSPPRLIVIADALAKNVALARDEREVSKVFEVIEPFAAELARSGRSPSNRRQMLRTIGQALLVRHRMSGRVEVEEKPDVLWDNPQLERLLCAARRRIRVEGAGDRTDPKARASSTRRRAR